MVLSFHPMLVAQANMICAGRDPGEEELSAIRKARAVILPQGCRESLYRMARDNAPHVFPDYRARFAFPGKTGQARLFAEAGVRTPRTLAFSSVSELPPDVPGLLCENGIAFPLVFKLDWGGESDGVHLVPDRAALARLLHFAGDCEGTGQWGFVLQEYVPSGGRSLRVVKAGSLVSSYFRVADGNAFAAAVSRGAAVDREGGAELQAAGRAAADSFCRKVGIDLAGIDLLFSQEEKDPQPYFLELNYFFGRKGLGGSEAFYSLLADAVDGWLASLGLSREPGRG